MTHTETTETDTRLFDPDQLLEIDRDYLELWSDDIAQDLATDDDAKLFTAAKKWRDRIQGNRAHRIYQSCPTAGYSP